MRPLSATPVDSLFRHGGAGPTCADWLDFSVNVNPLGPPQGVFRHLEMRALVADYPDPDCRRLTEALANHHQVAPECIVVGNGSSELIQIIPRALDCRRAAIVEPTYTEYLRACLLAEIPVDHWLCEPPDFIAAPFDPGAADLVWLANPNNPTSRLWPAGTLAPWIAAQPRTTFVVDEAFLPFVVAENQHTLCGEAARLGNLIVLRSLTKFYALAGLRLGYAVTTPALAERLRRHVPPWSVNGPAQVAGWAALMGHAVYRQQTLDWLQRDREPLVAQLGAFGQVLPPSANFALLRLRDHTASDLCHQLRERGLVLRNAANFVGLDDRYVRVAIRGAADNRRLIAGLRFVSQ